MALTKIIKFSAQWCAPCKVFATTFHKVKEMEDYKDIEFKEYDVENDEEGEELVEKFQVRSLPTTILLDENGEQLYKVMGNIPEKDFLEIINQAKNKTE